MSGVEDRQRWARGFAALADPTRLGVLELLRLQDLSPDALASRLGISGNLLAHHLKALQEAGLVRRQHSQHDRRRSYVQLTPESIAGLGDVLNGGPEGLSGPRLAASRVVFVCTHNSARSILANALWREASEVPSASAGTSPAARINPGARRAAKALGLRIAQDLPRSIDEVLRPDDLVVSVCDAVNEELPGLPNPRLHWSIADPSAVGTDDAFVAAAAQLRQRVERLARRAHARPHHKPRRHR